MMLLLATLLSASTALPAAPRTQYAVSTDGTRIAYHVTGSGPVVILLHGGGATRAYQPKLAGTKVTLAAIDGLTHSQEFERIDQVFSKEVEFIRALPR